MIHTNKGLYIVNEAEEGAFLEFPCFFYNTKDINNVISGSSSFSKFSLYIWNYSVHVLLKSHLNNFEQDAQAGFRKGRGTRDQIANIRWIIKKAREFQKNIYFCCIDYAKAFDSVDHNKLWKILREMGMPDHLTCLLRNLNAGQEATVRSGHGTTDWFQIGKGVVKAVYCHPAYLTYMQNIS